MHPLCEIALNQIVPFNMCLPYDFSLTYFTMSDKNDILPAQTVGTNYF